MQAGKEKIKISLEAYDHRVLDKAVQDIVDTAKRTGARVAGPIPMPTHFERFTVLRSPHTDKKSREQFEIRTHKRMIEILDPTSQTNEVFSKVDVPAGVEIKIRQIVR
jgi:small subunit ribosomal protein S10